MDIFTIVLTILGLCLFEIISSVDNAIINAEVLSTMSEKAKRWFLFWGILFAVFLVRGMLPMAIIYFTVPDLGLWSSITAAFSSDPSVHKAVDDASPVLLMGGGTFLVFLFLYWLFLEQKHYAFKIEKFFVKHGIWFYALASVLLSGLIWFSVKTNPIMCFGAALGASAFFITSGFKTNAEEQEKKLMKKGMSDISKIIYLELIDATFSIDGVLGAFAFTLSVPLILAGNGLGAVVLRQLTVGNIDRIKQYLYLKNGALYSVFFLGIIMIVDSFRIHIPEWVSPAITFLIVGYFFYRSRKEINRQERLEKKKGA
ncbi:MAG: DUF475 domain-containing protein [Ignavibacteria bacterium]|nr:DUF475 domain-containing protein [Ignavibacteria bacterium]